MENRCSMDNASRKGLSDITNLQQQPKVLNQGAKLLLQPASLRSKDYIDKLQQENMTLMKVLADRNKVIEMSAIELQKLRINLEKFQQQNLLLAQANSQMLAELNSGKDRLKSLRHELGCKNAALKAIQSEKKAKNVACPTPGNEVGTNKCGKAGESLKEEDGKEKLCNMNRCSKAGESLKEEDGENKPCNRNRRRQSTSLCPSNIKPVQVKEEVGNKRVCIRRQSARFKAQEPEMTKESFEVDDTKFLASSSDDKVHESGPSNIKLFQAKEGVDNKRVCLRRQSARLKAQEPETTEDAFEVDDTKFHASSSDDSVHENAPSNIKPVQDKGVDNKRMRLKRESARFKAQEPEMTEVVSEVDKIKFLASSCDDKLHKSGPSNIKPAQAEQRGENKRVCLRRQSARLKGLEQETTTDLFEVDDTRFLVSSSCDVKLHESGQLSSDSSVKSEYEERGMTLRNEAQELRRTSVGRPLRRAAEKVQSYKEMKLNVKMRREE